MVRVGGVDLNPGERAVGIGIAKCIAVANHDHGVAGDARTNLVPVDVVCLDTEDMDDR